MYFDIKGTELDGKSTLSIMAMEESSAPSWLQVDLFQDTEHESPFAKEHNADGLLWNNCWYEIQRFIYLSEKGTQSQATVGQVGGKLLSWKRQR